MTKRLLDSSSELVGNDWVNPGDSCLTVFSWKLGVNDINDKCHWIRKSNKNYIIHVAG